MPKPCKCGNIPDIDQLPQGYACPCMVIGNQKDYPDLAKVFPNAKYQPTENTADKLHRIKGGNRG